MPERERRHIERFTKAEREVRDGAEAAVLGDFGKGIVGLGDEFTCSGQADAPDFLAKGVPERMFGPDLEHPFRVADLACDHGGIEFLGEVVAHEARAAATKGSSRASASVESRDDAVWGKANAGWIAFWRRATRVNLVTGDLSGCAGANWLDQLGGVRTTVLSAS